MPSVDQLRANLSFAPYMPLVGHDLIVFALYTHQSYFLPITCLQLANIGHLKGTKELLCIYKSDTMEIVTN